MASKSIDYEGLRKIGFDSPIFVTNFINNKFSERHENINNLIPIINPSNGKILGYLPDSSTSEVEAAAEAALAAQESWAALPRKERSLWMQKIADRISSSDWFEKLAMAESLDSGKAIKFCRTVDIPRAEQNFRYFSRLITVWHPDPAIIGDDPSTLHYPHRKPVGVSGLISPWNLPLYLLTWKVAPCLAAGCACICKPSEVTSLTAFFLAKIMEEVGLPSGVFNVVFGTGYKAGQALVSHPQILAISFTGGTETGKKIALTCAPMFKKVSLELGGKNPSIILPDCDLDLAVSTSARAAFNNQGQICLCMSRVYVHASIYDQFVEELVKFTQENFKVGHPQDPTTTVGSLSSSSHLDKVKSYIELAKMEGGKLECGGVFPTWDEASAEETRQCLSAGAFLEPTIITGLDPCTSRVIKEEIFGPVVTINKFEDIESAISMANSTNYGLAACIFGKDGQTTRKVAQSIRAGMVWVNCWMVRDINTPFGGLKQSGVGKEGGSHSLEFFTELSNITLMD
ncbi:hypothetical protein DSO57_1008625 [Entomophthora muscae]|uniref:Uncharacterized protein n=1 Tax=Entomophthora muscae TaxID=34485 RepID=A0ACC2TUN2_9FUNG|nr:hypothetical protein DSO57_1008625 [Entomophthora muscae]